MTISVDELLAFALGLPGAEQRPRHRGHTAVEVAGRAFLLVDAGGEVVVRTTREEHAALVAGDPRTYAPSHVSGRFGWVVVRLGSADAPEVRELVTDAWRHSAPARLRDAGPTSG